MNQLRTFVDTFFGTRLGLKLQLGERGFVDNGALTVCSCGTIPCPRQDWLFRNKVPVSIVWNRLFGGDPKCSHINSKIAAMGTGVIR
jgi:hypothetical protein